MANNKPTPAASGLRSMIDTAAKRTGISPALLSALVQAESGGNSKAVSSAGAQGLTQLMPGTASGLGVKNSFDPMQNLMGGAKYLKDQLKRFGGNESLALAAYNAGPGAVEKAGNTIPKIPETQAYVKRVLALEQSYKANGLGDMGTMDSTNVPVPAGITPGDTPFKAETTMALLTQLLQPSEIAKSIMSKAGPMSEKMAASSDQTLMLGMLKDQMAQQQQAQGEPSTQAQADTPATPGDTSSTAQGTGDLSGDVAPASGKIIGTPNQGTHNLGNWESDNAIDVALPVGTPVVAMADGVIGPQFGSLGSTSSRFAGLRLHLVTADNEMYYAHLSKFAAGIKPGAQVKKGQVIGYSGSANGVAHLHLGVKVGDPTSLYGGS